MLHTFHEEKEHSLSKFYSSLRYYAHWHSVLHWAHQFSTGSYKYSIHMMVPFENQIPFWEKNNSAFNVKFNFAGTLRGFAHCVCVFHLCLKFWEYEACSQKKCVNSWEQLESVLLTSRPSSTLRAEEVWGLHCFNTLGAFEDWLLYWFFRDYSISLTHHVRLYCLWRGRSGFHSCLKKLVEHFFPYQPIIELAT